jgi:hypothetical protein
MTGRVEIPFEPLTALAGGILGGIIVGALAWRALWHAVRSTGRPTLSTHLTARGVTP